MQRFEDLAVWRQSHALTLVLYNATRGFPREENFGLTAQLRRAAVSVSCNIAEGSKRRHRPDYARFLNMAEGSAAEVESLLLLARDLGYLAKDQAADFASKTQEIARMLCSLRRTVERQG